MPSELVKTLPAELMVVDQEAINKAIVEAQEFAEQHANRLALGVEVYEAQGIQSEVDMERANEILGSIASARRTTEEKWEAPVSFFNKTHKTLTGWRKRGTDLFDRLRERIEKPMKAYVRAQEELARQRQAEAERAAEQLRRVKEAEARRLAREGEIAASREAKAMAEAITAPVLPGPEFKLEGTNIRRPWTVTIFEPMALVKAIAEGRAPLEAIKEFDVVFLKRRAAELGKEGVIYPGVRADQDVGFSTRA